MNSLKDTKELLLRKWVMLKLILNEYIMRGT